MANLRHYEGKQTRDTGEITMKKLGGWKQSKTPPRKPGWNLAWLPKQKALSQFVGYWDGYNWNHPKVRYWRPLPDDSMLT